MPTKEHERLRGQHNDPFVRPWRKWGPYVSDRSWGTVREDYSENGDAWNFLTHDLARSKAYRWGEDGIAAICDRYQILVFSLAFWNGRDPILKERFFGLNSSEGNHGEDVKEYYFYLDNTPTHSYMKMLYKYPQREFPYASLVSENRRRCGRGAEFELLDTGIFDDDRYFDIAIEYAKASEHDICIRVEAFNRGPDDAELHILPHLWFRNTWTWTEPPGPEPRIDLGQDFTGCIRLDADDRDAEPPKNLRGQYRLGPHHLYGPSDGIALFTFNETNASRVFGDGIGARRAFQKDAFHRYVVNGERDAVNPERYGTKASVDYALRIRAGESETLRLRLTPAPVEQPLSIVDETVRVRKREADEFYDSIHPPHATGEERMIQRQALAGLLWSKQIYIFDVNRWLDGDNPAWPPHRSASRNARWRHLNSMRLLSMPDKWEYPWFAAWDLAFHCIALALVDPGFAKDNLWFLLFEQFQHINGQIPAYEWEFSDLNPPVHAWACWRVYNTERTQTGRADRQFLEKCFHKLLINFAWWVNKVDSQGNSVFEGGFLGLDNITVVDRSERLANGGILEQSDGTGWMAFFCLYMMRIALELARENKTYEGLATKFFEHFVYIGAAMKNMGGREFQLWDERDGFFYDVLRYPSGEFHRFRVRSLVGLIPFFAVEVLNPEELALHPQFLTDIDWFVRNRPELVRHACTKRMTERGPMLVLSIVDEHQLKRLLERLWDPNEFLSGAGVRSLSAHHRDHPFVFGSSEVRYTPAEEDDVKLKGGNSNWRGPIWFPTSYLIVESLCKYADAHGPEFGLCIDRGDNDCVTPRAMAEEIADRLIGIFRLNAGGCRPVFGGAAKFQNDAHWRDCLLFYEHFHGDNGAGLGASHQTGWTALVANLIDDWRR